jgi:Flp pilus assembly protein TadG
MQMMTRWQHLRCGSADRSHEGGYVAVMTALLLMVFMGFAAFAVDVGHWYLVGQQEQRAADAAAMAGVTYLPGDPKTAFTTAWNYSKINGFQNGVSATVVTPVVDTQPTRLRVTVSQTVSNFFGSLMGVPTTKVARTAVADYAGPVPLGSPCNEFGADPEPNGHQSTNCNGEGSFWANVGSPAATKVSGDAYQDNVCDSSVDGCSGSSSGPNTDYDPNGYFYTVTVTQAMANLTIQAFDPALIDVGDLCTTGNLSVAKNLPYPAKAVVSDPLTRYADGAASPYCSGDVRYGGTGDVATQFTVRSPGPNPWNPLSFKPIGGTCTQTFAGYTGDLSKALDKTNAAYRPDVAANFRQWKTLCTIANAQPGTYLVQVNTNGLLSDAANGHNRFSLRAYGGSSAENDSLAVAGYEKMAMYGNTPNGTTKFFLARVPSGAKGQTFNVNLFDIGDGAVSGSTVTVLPPAETVPSMATFSNCTGAGVQVGLLSNCQISVSSSYNGKWQTISVPIPSTYSCTDASTTGCWLRLQFFYGTGSSPNDTTSWTASIVGDPVRLVQ